MGKWGNREMEGFVERVCELSFLFEALRSGELMTWFGESADGEEIDGGWGSIFDAHF